LSEEVENRALQEAALKLAETRGFENGRKWPRRSKPTQCNRPHGNETSCDARRLASDFENYCRLQCSAEWLEQAGRDGQKIADWALN